MRSLRFRLILVLVLVVVAVVGSIAVASIQVITRTFTGYEDRRGMLRDARFQRFLVGYYAQQEDWAAVQSEIERIGQITGGRVILASPDGQIVADSDGILVGQHEFQGWGRPPLPLVFGGAPVGFLHFSLPDAPVGEWFLVSVNRTLLLIAAAAGLAQIEATMTPAQLEAIVTLQLTQEDLMVWAEESGLPVPTFGGGPMGAGQGFSEEDRAVIRATIEAGGAPPGFPGGGDWPSEEQRAAIQATIEAGGGMPGGGRPGGAGRGAVNVLIGPLVELLTERAAE